MRRREQKKRTERQRLKLMSRRRKEYTMVGLNLQPLTAKAMQ
jgi:hypothetical protein